MNYVISIIAPTAEEKLVGICAELEIPLSVVLRGRGTAVRSMLELNRASGGYSWRLPTERRAEDT